jgi:hypothetical protein
VFKGFRGAAAGAGWAAALETTVKETRTIEMSLKARITRAAYNTRDDDPIGRARSTFWIGDTVNRIFDLSPPAR